MIKNEIFLEFNTLKRVKSKFNFKNTIDEYNLVIKINEL